MTWDGVACWRRGTPGKTTKQDCPAYYENPRVSWRSRRYNLSNLSPTCDGFMFVTKLIKTNKKPLATYPVSSRNTLLKPKYQLHLNLNITFFSMKPWHLKSAQLLGAGRNMRNMAGKCLITPTVLTLR